jgi:hypothetical protein
MTCTYDVTARTNRTRVRERVGDVSSTEPLVEDEVIDEALTELGTVGLASSRVARLMRARLVRLPDRNIEGVNVTRARLEAMDDLIRSLDAESGYGAVRATMTAGGTSRSAEIAAIDDPDYEPVSAGWADERVR